MLDTEELDALMASQRLPEAGMARVRWIRGNAPIRTVGGGRRGVKVRYISRKMPFALEAEAFLTEYAAMVTFDHDDAIWELYPQPCTLKITYINGKGKKVTPLITPDLFLIGVDGFVFVECKIEEELLKLAKRDPNRYQHGVDGRWRSPPAEAAAAEYGMKFVLRSSKQNNWALVENCDFLEDYNRDQRSEPDAGAIKYIHSIFEVRPWVHDDDS